MITTILFDIGNVLVGYDHRAIWQRLAAFSTMSAENIEQAIMASGVFARHEIGQLSAPDLFRDVQECGHLLPSLSYDTFCSAWQDIFWEQPDVTQLIRPLQRRYQVGLISNIGELHWAWILERFPIVAAIDEPLRILSFQVGAMKPAAAIFTFALQQAHAQPEECVYIDDLATHIQGGLDVGMRAFQYRSAEAMKADLQGCGVIW